MSNIVCCRECQGSQEGICNMEDTISPRRPLLREPLLASPSPKWGLVFSSTPGAVPAESRRPSDNECSDDGPVELLPGVLVPVAPSVYTQHSSTWNSWAKREYLASVYNHVPILCMSVGQSGICAYEFGMKILCESVQDCIGNKYPCNITYESVEFISTVTQNLIVSQNICEISRTWQNNEQHTDSNTHTHTPHTLLHKCIAKKLSGLKTIYYI